LGGVGATRGGGAERGGGQGNHLESVRTKQLIPHAVFLRRARTNGGSEATTIPPGNEGEGKADGVRDRAKARPLRRRAARRGSAPGGRGRGMGRVGLGSGLLGGGVWSLCFFWGVFFKDIRND